MTGAELAAAMGISQAYQSAIESGKRMPSRELLYRYAEYFNVSADYLMGNDDVIGKSPKVRDTQPLVFARILPTTGPVPKAALKAPPETDFAVVWDRAFADMYDGTELRAIVAEGDSMSPQIDDGDTVIFAASQEWSSGEIFVVRLDGRLCAKALVFDAPEKPPLLRSANRAYPDVSVREGQDFEICGRAVLITSRRAPKPVI